MTGPLQIDPSQVDDTANSWQALLAQLGFNPPPVMGGRPTHQAAQQGYQAAGAFTDEVKARQAALAANTQNAASGYQGQDQASAKGLSSGEHKDYAQMMSGVTKDMATALSGAVGPLGSALASVMGTVTTATTQAVGTGTNALLSAIPAAAKAAAVGPAPAASATQGLGPAVADAAPKASLVDDGKEGHDHHAVGTT